MAVLENLNWTSTDSPLYLNPRLPNVTANKLIHLYTHIKPFEHLKAHIILTTSGTHQLKLVALKKDAFLCAATSVNNHINATKEDRWLNPLPPFHVGGLGIHARAYLSQSTVIGLSKWSVPHFIERIKTNQITLTSLVPTQLFDIVSQNKKCPPSLRHIFIGGSALSSAVANKARILGWPISTCYGMTETASQILINGKAYPHVKIKTDPRSKKLMITSDCLLTGYCELINDSPQLIDPKKNGWFLTDDHCEIKNDKITILGRGSEMVKIGGELVSLQRLNLHLDNAKFQSNFKEKAVLIAEQDNRLGNHIVLRTNSKKTEKLIQYYHQICSPFERIKYVNSKKLLL